jgi:spore coat protein CotH
VRKLIVLLVALAISSYSLSVSAATAPSSFLKISEVDCNNEWVEITNTHPSLTLNVKNYFFLVIETDGSWIQNDFNLPKSAIKAGKYKVFTEAQLGFGFGCGDESILLFDSSQKELDRIAIPNLADAVTWSRFGTTWGGSQATQGIANVALDAQTPIDQAAWIFDQLQSFRINLSIDEQYLDPNNPNGLVLQPKVYVPATFRFRDATGVLLPSTGALQVGVRTKGSVGSTNGGQVNISNGKIGLKVKFNWSIPGQEFLGLKRLTLNNMLQDPSMVRDVLSYKLFTAMGLVAPRTGFARVYINGDNYGLYLNLESFDEIMMARWRSSMQHMYDATWAPGWNAGSESCTSDWVMPEITVDDYRCNFEIDRGDPEDFDDIAALAEAMDSQESLSPDAKKIIYVDQIAKFFAVEKYISHWDGQSGSPSWTPNNFRMYSNSKGRLELLPWGTDGTWYQFSNDGWEPENQVNGLEPFYNARSDLFMQCIRDDECNAQYLKALVTIADIAQYQDFAQELFDAHTAVRANDTKRFWNENDSNWGLLQTLAFMNMRDEMAREYAYEVASGLIRWTPAKKTLSAGTKLTLSLLNAYSDVLGTITYSKKLGAVLKKGKYSIKATLTPVDVAEWPVQSKTIKFTVK